MPYRVQLSTRCNGEVPHHGPLACPVVYLNHGRNTGSLDTLLLGHGVPLGIHPVGLLLLRMAKRRTAEQCSGPPGWRPVYFRARCACAWPIVRTLAVPPLRRAHRRDHREPRHDALVQEPAKADVLEFSGRAAWPNAVLAIKAPLLTQGGPGPSPRRH